MNYGNNDYCMERCVAFRVGTHVKGIVEQNIALFYAKFLVALISHFKMINDRIIFGILDCRSLSAKAEVL